MLWLPKLPSLSGSLRKGEDSVLDPDWLCNYREILQIFTGSQFFIFPPLGLSFIDNIVSNS